MNPTPLVSILVPVWNRENLIEETLLSALNQTITDLEVIVVDNASTDSTWSVIQKVAARDSRVRPHRNEANVGPVRNWRRAADLAKGKFAKILWSDDLITPDFLEQTLPHLEKEGVGFVWTGVKVIDDGGQTISSMYDDPMGILSGAKFIRIMLGVESHCQGVPVSPGCALMPTATLVKAVHFDIPNRIETDFLMHGIGNDQHIFLELAAASETVVHISAPLALFRYHQGSITVTNDWGRCALMYRIGLQVFVDQNEGRFLTGKEQALFNAHSEVLRFRYRGQLYGITDWRDFHSPDSNGGEVDGSYLKAHLIAALREEALRQRAAEASEPISLSIEAIEAACDLVDVGAARQIRLRSELDRSKHLNSLLKERIKYLMGPWVKFGWRLFPWTKPSWRNSPHKDETLTAS